MAPSSYTQPGTCHRGTGAGQKRSKEKAKRRCLALQRLRDAKLEISCSILLCIGISKQGYKRCASFNFAQTCMLYIQEVKNKVIQQALIGT